jgi:hypothetical protein
MIRIQSAKFVLWEVHLALADESLTRMNYSYLRKLRGRENVPGETW